MVYFTKIHIGASSKEYKDFHKFNLLFGVPSSTKIIEGKKYAFFPENSIVGYERWHANGFGKTIWNIFIIRTVSPGETVSRISGVHPGAEIICHTETRHYSGKFAKFIETIDKSAPDIDKLKYVAKQINLGLAYCEN